MMAKSKADHQRVLRAMVQKGVISHTMNTYTMVDLIEAHDALDHDEFAEAVIGALPVPTWKVLEIYKHLRRAWRPSALTIRRLEKEVRRQPWDSRN